MPEWREIGGTFRNPMREDRGGGAARVINPGIEEQIANLRQSLK